MDNIHNRTEEGHIKEERKESYEKMKELDKEKIKIRKPASVTLI